MNKLKKQNTKSLLQALTHTRTEKINQANRHIIEYAPADVGAFFDAANGVYNTLVAGGLKTIRNAAIIAQTTCALQNHFPVILLHENNYELEKQLRQHSSSVFSYREINFQHSCFDPFYGLSTIELADQIKASAPEYNINSQSFYYICAINEILRFIHQPFSFNALKTCPHRRLFDIANELEKNNIINHQQAEDITNNLMLGQSEKTKLQSFCLSFNKEIAPILWSPSNGSNSPINVFSAVQTNKPIILNFNIGSTQNKLLLNTLVFQLNLALQKGFQYALILDDISLYTSVALTDFVKTPHQQIPETICSKDLYLFCADKTLSDLILTKMDTLIVMNQSQASAEAFSAAFGKYDKYEESVSISRHSILSPTFSYTRSYHKSKEPVISEKGLMNLARNEAYVRYRGETGHLFLHNT